MKCSKDRSYLRQQKWLYEGRKTVTGRQDSEEHMGMEYAGGGRVVSRN